MCLYLVIRLLDMQNQNIRSVSVRALYGLRGKEVNLRISHDDFTVV